MFKFFKRNRKAKVVTATPKMLKVTFKRRYSDLQKTVIAPTIGGAWKKMDYNTNGWLCWNWEEIEN